MCYIGNKEKPFECVEFRCGKRWGEEEILQKEEQWLICGISKI